jgi:AraC family transcriptional regulator
MKQLTSGQHYGDNKKILKLSGTLLSEATCKSTLSIPWHFHENAFFFYLLKGRTDEVNRKEIFTCETGTLLFHNWQEPHFNKNVSNDANFFHLEIEKEWFEKYNIDNSKIEGSIRIENPFVKTFIKNLHQEIKINDAVSQISVDGLLLQTFSSLQRSLLKKNNSTPNWVEKVKELIHFSLDEKLTLQMIANETKIHPVHLSKEFPKYFNCSFGEYIRAQKIGKAINLLQNTKMTISEIAYECGFADQSHFIRIFKNYYEVTPLKFRKN